MLLTDKFLKKLTQSEKKGISTKFNAQEIIELLEEEPKTIICLYRLVNTKNFTEDDCEIVCNYLLDNIKIFNNIPVLTYAGESKREKDGWKLKNYRKDSREGYPQKMTSVKERDDFKNKYLDNLDEDSLAMRIYLQERKDNKLESIRNLGYILDYQMPIGGNNKHLYTIKQGDKYEKDNTSYPYGVHVPDDSDNANILFKVGNCDLVAYSEKDDKFIILELKRKDSEEPLIRAVLEAYTYKRLLNTEEATRQLKKYYKEIIPEEADNNWRAAPLLYVGGNMNKEYKNENSKLRELMRELDVDPIWYNIEDRRIVIVEG